MILVLAQWVKGSNIVAEVTSTAQIRSLAQELLYATGVTIKKKKKEKKRKNKKAINEICRMLPSQSLQTVREGR